MQASAVITLDATGVLVDRVPRSNEHIDWSVCPPIVGAKAWYWNPTTSTWYTENTDDEPNWRKWPRDNLLGVVIFHRDPAKPAADYRTIEVGYDFVRVPGMPGNLDAFEGVWIDDTNWETVKAEMMADAWRPA